jgi:hypothetical protein
VVAIFAGCGIDVRLAGLVREIFRWEEVSLKKGVRLIYTYSFDMIRD